MNKHMQNEKKTHLCVVDASRPVKSLAINGLEAWQTNEVYNLVPKKKADTNTNSNLFEIRIPKLTRALVHLS